MIERVQFIVRRRGDYWNNGDCEEPEHVLDIRFSWQERTGEGNFGESDQAEVGKDGPENRENDKMNNDLMCRPERERQDCRDDPPRKHSDQQ